MSSKMLLMLAAIVGGILFLPRIVSAMRPEKPEAPPPPPPAPPAKKKKKKSIFGKIVGGVTSVLKVIPHPAAQGVAAGLDKIG
jgi:hypothetical protein